VLEEGGQGVLIHPKTQGLRANRARRPVDRTLAIVSKSSAHLIAWDSARKNEMAWESTQVGERATPPELAKGPPATERSDGCGSLGQVDGAQGALIQPEWIRGCEQT